ncbi:MULTISPECIES: BglII/BstYI family type II restriction endonuclease [unclassified Archaeoglobus]|jgi:hypothetical protein|uniref:BglII/BstYI family type II restriction endonuclease n=1 Tax=unclassified Archaeoglobus TaxID=2643606 RepID=UPI0025C1D43C|nr:MULTISPECIES: BglII/BstYI family type II restriction endonuclease [unclassified Archaeoglobus]
MKIVAKYQIKGGERYLKENCPRELEEIYEVIQSVDAEKCLNKVSKEKTMKGRVLYNPRCLNKFFKDEFTKRGWSSVKVQCIYEDTYYLPSYKPLKIIDNAYREMDYVKNRIGVEVQFGKYAFMVYNVSAKMTIFHNLDIIDAGVEIVPVKEMQDMMSTGVSFF